ncbi:MFS transporter, partial [Mycobacterium tuberculosis]
AARAGWSLARLPGASAALLPLAFLVGPALGGLLLAPVGGLPPLWLPAPAFGLSLLALAALPLAGAGPPPP